MPDSGERKTNGEVSQQTVLQKHCAFWDRDGDGVIWPTDTYHGFRELGFNLIICVLSVFIIHPGFSYPSVLKTSYIPDPLLRVHLDGIDKCLHGSDTASYDSRGRFQPSQFDQTFEKYARTTPEGLTVRETFTLLEGQRNILDFFGWFGALFEWYTTVLLTYDRRTGVCGKEHIRRIYE